MSEEKKYRMSWTVTHQHSQVFTAGQLRTLAIDDLDMDEELDMNDESDVNAVWDRLDKGDWKADEVLRENATEHNWVDNGESEIHDLRPA